MPEVRADAASDVVSEAPLGADVVEQARGESTAERLVEHRNGVIVRIVTGGAEPHHMNAALVYIFFRNFIVAGRGGMILNVLFGQFSAFGPGFKRSAQLGFHGFRIEVAAEAQDYMVWMNIGLMPIDQVLPGDSCNGGIFRLTRVRIVFPVSELGGLASGDYADVVVATRDAVVGLLLRQIELVGTELGISQQVCEYFEDVVEVAFQAV